MNEKSQQPLVTVALPVFNGAKTLAIAIQSVLDQSYSNFELIVIDDGSIDDSVSITRSFVDKRIKLIVCEHNIGLSACINIAVKQAFGSYLARMDQDDICFPDRIEKQVAFMLQNTHIDLLATATLIFTSKYKVLGVLPVKTIHSDICISPFNGFYMPHPTWLGRIEWFLENKYDSSANGAEDQNLLFRSYKSSNFACLSEPLIAYREDKRKFKKMFKARWVFVKANAKYAWEENYRLESIRILISQLIKLLGDFSNIVLRVSSVRNTLSKPDEETLSVWANLLRQYGV